MATRTVTSYASEALNPCQKMVEAASGPGKAPYIDGRELAAICRQASQVVTGSFIVGTTTDDAGNVIADADDVQLHIGFKPKLFLLVMENGANSELYVKTAGMEIAAIKDYSFLVVNGVAPAWTNNSIRFSNDAETDISYVTVYNGITTNTREHRYTAIG